MLSDFLICSITARTLSLMRSGRWNGGIFHLPTIMGLMMMVSIRLCSDFGASFAPLIEMIVAIKSSGVDGFKKFGTRTFASRFPHAAQRSQIAIMLGFGGSFE